MLYAITTPLVTVNAVIRPPIPTPAGIVIVCKPVAFEIFGAVNTLNTVSVIT
jgi:hypothetical protein